MIERTIYFLNIPIKKIKINEKTGIYWSEKNGKKNSPISRSYNSVILITNLLIFS